MMPAGGPISRKWFDSDWVPKPPKKQLTELDNNGVASESRPKKNKEKSLIEKNF